MSKRRLLVHLIVKLQDGTELENSRQQGRPVLMTCGDGSLSPELESQLEGLKPGDRRCFQLPAEQVFGAYRPDLVQFMERHQFPPHAELEEGQIIAFQDARGQELPGVVKCVQGHSVQVDFNLPFIRETLTFDVEVLQQNPGTRVSRSSSIPVHVREEKQ